MTNYEKQDPETIKTLFNNIADRYDLGNSLLSFHIHRYWNRSFAKKLYSLTPQSTQFLDICAGTGEITKRIARIAAPSSHFTLVDFSEEMLHIAEDRLSFLPSCLFHVADAHHLPLPNDSFDTACMAYGLRNLYDPLQGINEAFRVLKPGGVLGIIELTQPNNFFLKKFHSTYLKTIVPCIGKLCTKDKEAYKYLCNSIHTFTKISVENLLKEAGFIHIETISLSFGIATLFFAKKVS